LFVNLEGPAAAAPILQRLTDWLNKNNENKLWAAIITVVLGVILRDLIPYTWRLIGKGLAWVGKHIGGKFGFNYFEKTYLNWLVTELRELKLAGIVSTDATKKPKLEQVFVSLRVGDQQDRSSILEITQAVLLKIYDIIAKLSQELYSPCEGSLSPPLPPNGRMQNTCFGHSCRAA